MKYKAIIFDMDGTIVDSNHIWKQATRDLILSRGVTPTPEVFDALEEQLKGLALHASCKIIKELMAFNHSVEELVAEKQQRALNLYKSKVKFIEGFQEFHRKVLSEPLSIGIATNADDHTLSAAVTQLDLKGLFGEHIYNITHVDNRHKPAPDIYLHTAKKLNVNPEHCVAIEDSGHGIRAAVDAGMFCIGINTGKNRESLKDAHLIIDHYNEIELERLLKKARS